nr:unnamed protein product [Callosobruchus chinensis]
MHRAVGDLSLFYRYSNGFCSSELTSPLSHRRAVGDLSSFYRTLSILDAVQRRAFRLIGDPALTCHLQLISHRYAVGDLSLFY